MRTDSSIAVEGSWETWLTTNSNALIDKEGCDIHVYWKESMTISTGPYKEYHIYPAIWEEITLPTIRAHILEGLSIVWTSGQKSENLVLFCLLPFHLTSTASGLKGKNLSRASCCKIYLVIMKFLSFFLLFFILIIFFIIKECLGTQ